MQHASLLCVLFLLVGCAAPAKPAPPDPGLQGLRDDLERVEQHLARFESHLGHLASELSASSSEHEFTALTLESLQLAGDGASAWPGDGDRSLRARVGEWHDYGKLLRFTRLADPVVFLEADGVPPLEARIQPGGVCTEDGSVRDVVLTTSGELERDVEYRVRPRNHNARYRWLVGPAATITRR